MGKHGRIMLGWEAIPGKPSIAWHADDDRPCFQYDQKDGWPLAQPYDERQAEMDGTGEIVAEIRRIEARGSGRVVANKEWGDS